MNLKIALIKEKRKEKDKGSNWKQNKTTDKLIEGWNWKKKKNFNKSAKNKIRNFKKIKTEMKNQTYKKLQLND